MSHEVLLLTEIRDLLQVIAEPELAKRDAKMRASLRSVVGDSAKKAKAVQLMDGTRSQAGIVKESGMDQGNLSRLMKALANANLITSEEKNPKLLVKVPSRFFDGDSTDE